MTLTTGPAVGQVRPQFRTTVEVVQMQVIVADSRGSYISGLTKEDFLLRVDGEARDLTALYEVDLGPTGNAAVVADEFVPAAGWRQFLLFFDFSFSTRRGLLRARDSAVEFVQRYTHPRDLIAVATYSTVGGLRLVSPFTADRGQVLNAMAGFGLNRSGYIVDPAGFAVAPLNDLLEMQQAADFVADDNSTRAELEIRIEEVLFSNTVDSYKSDFRRYREEVVNYADQLVALGAMLTATRGRKHVLLFSSGFDDKVLAGQSLDEMAFDNQLIQEGNAWAVNSESRFGSADLRQSLSDALDNLLAADTVFHVFDSSGLGNDRVDDTFQTTQTGKQGLSYLAEGTNGTISWNSNDLMPFLADLSESTSRYYVIAYAKRPGDRAVVDIDIEVLRAGAKVTAAPTRLAPPPAYADMDGAQRQLQLSEFISKGIVEEDMIFDVRAIPFVGNNRVSRIAVLTEVPYQQLATIAQARGDGKAELDILGYIMDDDGQMRDLFSRRVVLDVERLAQSGEDLPFRYYDLLWSVKGEHQVRVLVRDAEVGMLSTRTQTIDVPSFRNAMGIVVSGPVAVDAVHPGLLMRGIDPEAPPAHRSGGPVAYPFVIGDQEFTPQVYTLAEPGGSCYFLLVAHNLGRHPFTGKVETAVNALAIDELGQEHVLSAINLVARDFDAQSNTTSLLLEARLPESLRAGAYLLQIDLVDAIAGQTIEEIMPFLVTETTDR